MWYVPLALTQSKWKHYLLSAFFCKDQYFPSFCPILVNVMKLNCCFPGDPNRSKKCLLEYRWPACIHVEACLVVLGLPLDLNYKSLNHFFWTNLNCNSLQFFACLLHASHYIVWDMLLLVSPLFFILFLLVQMQIFYLCVISKFILLVISFLCFSLFFHLLISSSAFHQPPKKIWDYTPGDCSILKVEDRKVITLS